MRRSRADCVVGLLLVLCSLVVGQYNSNNNQYPNPYPNQNPTQSSYGNSNNFQQQQAGVDYYGGRGQQSQQQQQNAGNSFGSSNQQQWQTGQGGAQNTVNQPLAPGVIPLRFCAVDAREMIQCQAMVYALKGSVLSRSNAPDMSNNYGSRNIRQVTNNFRRFEYSCVQAVDKLECMNFIKNDLADIVLLAPGEAYVGEKEFGLQAVVAEVFGVDKLDGEDQAMAVVRTTSGITDISQLRGRRACFGQVGDMVTWDLVASYLGRQANQLSTPQCHENSMDVMMKYFGDMCAPYDTRNYTQEENDRYRKLCTLCGGGNCPPLSTVALNRDYSINCLMQSPSADVAFVSASALREALSTIPNADNYQILCPNSQPIPLRSPTGGGGGNYQYQPGQTRMLDEAWTDCHIGRIPSHVWVTRQNFQYTADAALKINDIHVAYMYASAQKPQWLTSYFTGSYRHAAVPPSGVKFSPLRPTSIDSHLGTYKAYLEDPTVCSSAQRAKWCVTSALEFEKCNIMKLAFQAHRIRPELECQAAVKNPYICLDKVNRNQTDVAMVDVGDLVAAGSHYNAIQVAQERFVTRDRLGSSITILDETFSIAVVRDPSIRSLNDLRGKRACFSGLFEANGFMLPINALRRNGLIGHSDCQNIRAAAEYFGDSCLPGLSDAELNLNVGAEDKAKLCRQCEGGERMCMRGGENKYAGQLGALNCLREGKGDVAFVSHTVLQEIPDEQRRLFYLVCGQTSSGTAQSTDTWNNCNLEKAPGGVLVTNRYKPPQEKRRLADMLLTASSLFSADLTMNNFEQSRIDLRSGSMDRARKTYNMFGKRNRTSDYLNANAGYNQNTGNQWGQQTQNWNQYQTTSASYYNPNQPNNQNQNQNQFNPQPLSTVTNQGYYSIFSPSAYDLRGFGDINTTYVSSALGTYQDLAERSNWRICIDTGGAGTVWASMLSVVFMVVLGRILS